MLSSVRVRVLWQDAARFGVAGRALGDPHRRYHFTLLHFSDTDSQATTYGISDVYNQANMNVTPSRPQDAPWAEYIPDDTVGFRCGVPHLTARPP